MHVPRFATQMPNWTELTANSTMCNLHTHVRTRAHTHNTPTHLAHLLGRRIIGGAVFELLLPHVIEATAVVEHIQEAEVPAWAPRRFRVTATVTGTAGTSAMVWWNASPNRTYNSASQPQWSFVPMDGSLKNLSSPWITMPNETDEAAWYVEATCTAASVPRMPKQAANISDASPVRFVFRTPAKTCAGTRPNHAAAADAV